MKAVLHENYVLRDFIILLQSRLMEASLDVPEAPSNIDLSQPRHDLSMAAAAITGPGPGGPVHPVSAPQQAQHPVSANDDMNSLNRIAVAGLGMRKHPDENAFMGANFQQHGKRGRGDENQPDGSDALPKQEAHHGLPMA